METERRMYPSDPRFEDYQQLQSTIEFYNFIKLHPNINPEIGNINELLKQAEEAQKKFFEHNSEYEKEEVVLGKDGGVFERGCSLVIGGEVTVEVADQILLGIAEREDRPDIDHLNIYLNSNGGDLGACVMVAEAMQQCKKPINTIAIGAVYSGATLILAAGDVGSRWAWPTARIGLHEISIDTSECEVKRKNINEVRRDILDAEEANNFWLQQLSRYTGQTVGKLHKDLEGTDKYFKPADAIKYGILDHILLPPKVRGKV